MAQTKNTENEQSEDFRMHGRSYTSTFQGAKTDQVRNNYRATNKKYQPNSKSSRVTSKK